MDETLKNLIEKLPQSPTQLDEDNKEKIYSIFPVPTDYKIMWADIISLKGYPAGIIITDKALVLKASKKQIKQVKKEIKKENKNSDTKEKAPKFIYQLIPWEYFNPEEYEVKVDDKQKYILYSGKIGIGEFTDKGFYELFSTYKKSIIEAREKAEATFSAITALNAEDTMFNAIYGKANTKTGHGIYAEEAGAILDKLSGEKVSVVGRDNAKNGPDKIVNASPVQCKYCKNAASTIESCFKRNSETGAKTFRYFDLNDNVMQIEVPADQYVDAVEKMKIKILDGKVPGINDPNEAHSIIRKGKLTYNQAVNLAKAGTIQSLAYDSRNGAVTCLSAFGISAVVSFAQIYWVTGDYKKAGKSAIMVGLQVYGVSFVGYIIASQISRTSLTSVLNPLAKEVSEFIGPNLTQEIINSFRALAGKKAIHGAAAQKSFVKFIGSNAITQVIMLLVFSTPDTYRLLNKKISVAQYVKNITSLGGTIGGSAVGGAAVGHFIGNKIDNKYLKIVAYAVATATGAILGATIKGVGNLIREDDMVIAMRLFNAVLQNRCIEYMLIDEEVDNLIDLINKDEKELKVFLQDIRISQSQEKDIIEYLDRKIHDVIEKRDVIENEEEKMKNTIASIFLRGELGYEM